MRCFSPGRAVWSLIALLACAATAVAQDQPAFSRALSPANWIAAGFPRLNTPQVVALDAQIQRDIQAAREGDVVAFAQTFTERRTPQEQQQAGLDRLTPPERANLDRLVAAEIAHRPTTTFAASSIRPRVPATITEKKPLPEVHGQVSMFVGGSSHGGSFYGGSFDAVLVDPNRRWTVGVGMSEIRGRGLPACLDDRYW